MNKFSPKALLMKGRRSYHDMIQQEAGLISSYSFGASQGNKLWDQKGTNHGTIDGATWTQKANGLWTLDFDGQNDYVGMGNVLNFGAGNFTIEAWVKTSKTIPNDVLSKRNGLNEQGWILSSGTLNANNLVLQVQDGAGTESTVIGTIIINDGAWHYISAKREGNTGYVYIDGANEQTTDFSDVGSISNARELRVGINSDGARQFNGLINEVAIYNVALSLAQIKRHYVVGVWEGLAEA